jgi:tetratricopeptide (TPR) repeat protein
MTHRALGAIATALLLSSCSAPADEAVARFELARSRYWRSDYEGAAPLYEQALELRPKLRDAYHELAWCYEALGRQSEAIKTLERSLRDADAKDERALRELARLYVHKGFLEEAIRACVALAAVAPADEQVRLELARLEMLRPPDTAAEQARLAKARARYEELRAIAERLYAERKFDDAILTIDTYPEEWRDTEYWKKLQELREKAAKAKQP